MFKSNHLNKLLISLAAIVALVFVFTAGVFVGHEKARFSQRWGENYYRNIMGPERGGMMGFERGPNFNGRSGMGQIIKIEGNNIIVKDQANIEKTILATDKTVIMKNDQNIKITDLKVDDKIVAIGNPNDSGQVEPKFIRVLPDQPPVMPGQK